MHRLSEATCSGSLDMLPGYWQIPLAPDSQEIFTIAGPGGLYTPTRRFERYFLPPRDHDGGAGWPELHGLGG